MRSTTTALVTALTLALTGLASADELAERERAAADATKAFVGELGGALKRELGKGSPAEAIDVCSELAPSIANRLSRENGWRVTRVGTRVRNPTLGMPDAWEQQVLKQFATRAAEGANLAEMKHAEVVQEPDGSYFRYMKPLGVKPVCLACHGSTEQIDPSVAEALARHYPADRAIGYSTGDLRGAISIKQPMEIPLR